MQRIKNITEYFQYDIKKTKFVFHASGDENSTLVEFDITPVGPAVVRAQAPDDKGKPGQTWLVGVYDEPETLRFALPFKAVQVIIEPSLEAWVRRPRTVAAHENPNEDETFTRMEKQGIDLDPMTVALHRQAIMTRIATNRENVERDSYTSRLERGLADLAAQVEALTAAKQAEPPSPENPTA